LKGKADIVVVGAGPCGSFSALTAAKLGADVVVCEEHGEIGSPEHCAGHVSVNGLSQLGMRLPRKIVENEIRGAVFHSPLGSKFLVEHAFPVTYVVNRKLLDRHLADLAVEAGARYLTRSKVESLILHSGFVRGIVLRRMGERETLTSKVVIDAEGCSSVLLKRARMQTLDRSMVVNAVQAKVNHVDDVDRDLVEVYLGRRYAPGFFAWIIPRRDGSAKVGLATNRGDPREYLWRFMREHPVASEKFGGSKVIDLSLHPISLGGAIPKTYANGLLIVGDAASHVKPTTGGGIILGMLCSKIAGEVAYEALQENDVSEDFLSRYQSLWREAIGFDMMVMHRVRKLLDRLTDREIDAVIKLCARFKVNEVLEDRGDLDFQGRSLISMIRHPKMLIPMVFAFFSSLT